MNTSLTYSVQIINGEEQLTEALGLRYKTYKKVYPKLTANCTRPYETDVFDSRSIHLGLYAEDEKGKKLAGYCRLILPLYYETTIPGALIKQHPEYRKDKPTSMEEKLALIERLPFNDSKKINNFCNSLEEENIIYAETSRFIIDVEHRSISLSAFFVSSMFATAYALNIGYIFFGCQPHHSAFYKKFGCTLFPGISMVEDDILEVQSVLFGTDLRIANAQQTTINRLKLQLESEKQITFRRAA